MKEVGRWPRRRRRSSPEGASGACRSCIRSRPAVISTRVGYSGGDVPNATYRNHGDHAEAVEIVFDPEQISYRDLLEFFFQIHDPTTKNRQGNDIGTQLPFGDLLHRPTSSGGSRTTRSPTSTPPASGRARSSPRSSRRARSGRPSRSTRTTCRVPNGYTCHFVRPDWKLPHRDEQRVGGSLRVRVVQDSSIPGHEGRAADPNPPVWRVDGRGAAVGSSDDASRRTPVLGPRRRPRVVIRRARGRVDGRGSRSRSSRRWCS